MKKCPFCAEGVKDEAIICKHCQRDLTSKEAIKLFKRQEVLERIRQKDEARKKKQEQAKKEYQKFLKSLSETEKVAYFAEEKRKKLVKILWVVAGILSVLTIVKYSMFSAFILFAAIWLHPRKKEKWFINRFRNWKQYKLRMLFTSLIILFAVLSLTTHIAEQREIQAKKERKEFIETYPKPEIQLLSSKDNQGEAVEYLLEFRANNAETVLVNNKEIADKDGKFSQKIPLEKMSTRIRIVASNEHKNNKLSFTIERQENEQEKQERLTREAKAKIKQLIRDAEEKKRKQEELKKQQEKEEAERKEIEEWERSKAGKLCAKYPTWSKTECTRVAETRRAYWIGMSYEMLVEGWGKPNSANPSNYGYGTQWQYCYWDYTPSCFYDENDDNIIDSYN